MSINTDLNRQLVDQMFAIYSHAETVMLEKVKKRIEKGITEQGWNERKLKEVQSLRNELEAIMNDVNKLANSKISEGIIDAYEKGGASATTDFSLPKQTILRETKLKSSVQNLLLESNNLVTNVSNRILRSTMDAYRDIQAEVATGVITGIETRKQATQRMLNKFADRGITGFVDKAGRNWDMATYSEMATRTVTANAALSGHVDRQVENNRDLIIISDHVGECPLCRPWENKILSISGNDPKYPSLSSAREAGLFHPNCRHTLTGYIEGMTEITESKVKDDGEAHLYSQRQRANERSIRRWKRREVVAISDIDKLKAKRKIKFYQGKQRDLIKDYEDKFGVTIRRKYDRESISNRAGLVGVDKSPSWAKPVVEKKPVIDIDVFRDNETINLSYKRMYASQFKQINKLANGIENEAVKKYINKHIPNLRNIEHNPDGAFYDPNIRYIKMNIEEDMVGPKGKGVTFFHEFGHHVDDMEGTISTDTKFIKAIEKDYKAYLEKHELDEKLDDWVRVKLASRELQELGGEGDGISDMMSGLSLNKVKGNYAHSNEYWSRGNRMEEVSSEAFAHFFGASVHEKKWKMIKKYFPNATKEFLNLLK